MLMRATPSGRERGPDLVGAQVVELDVAVVVARADAALLVVEAVAEANAPAVPRLRAR